MKYQRLSAIFVAATAATILMASPSFAGHKASELSYKGENFKAEVPAPCPPAMVLRDGFYIGLGASYDSTKLKQSSTFDDGVNDFSTLHMNHSLTGWDGALFVGYGMYFDTFYLGAELGASISNAESTLSATDVEAGVLDSSFSSKLRTRTSYNAAIIPGIKVNDSTLLYVRGGYTDTQFKASASVVDEAGVVAGSFSETKWKGGWHFGVGMETYLAEQISARGEYTYTSYSSFNLNRAVENTAFDSTKLSPSSNAFTLSLIYHV